MDRRFVRCLFIFVCVVFGVFMSCAFAEDGDSSEGYSYTQDGIVYWIQDDQAMVTGHDTTPIDVAIPDHVEGVPVTVIADGAFYDCRELRSVELPSTLLAIGLSAFENCKMLSSVELPEGLQQIGICAFLSCESLRDSEVFIPKSVTFFGQYAFGACGLRAVNVDEENEVYSSVDGVLMDKDQTVLIWCPENKEGSFSIPDTVVYLNLSAFAGCSKLTGVLVVPQGVNIIPDDCFGNCCLIEEIVLHEGITYIGDDAFSGCQNIKKLEIPRSVEFIGINCFSGMKSLESMDISFIDITEIPEGLFHDCEKLTNLKLPSGIKSIGQGSFTNCASLHRDIGTILTEDVEYVGLEAFDHCIELTGTVYFPEGQTEVYSGTFRDCKKIEKVVLPESVDTIGWIAFEGCSSLTEVEARGTILYVEDWAFDGTPWLANQGDFVVLSSCLIAYNGHAENVVIPKQVTSISISAMSSLLNADSFGVEAGNTAFCSADGVLFSADRTVLIAYPRRKTGAYTVPEGVQEIRERAFYECSKLTSAAFPGSLISIGKNAFERCGLTELILPDSVKEIGQSAFSENLQLERAVFGSGLEIIDSYAFFGCSRLKAAVIPNGVVIIDAYAFSQSGVQEVVLPETLKGLGICAFNDCNDLKSVFIYCDCPAWYHMGKYNSLEYYSQYVMEGLVFFGSRTDTVALYIDNDASGYDIEIWKYYNIETDDLDDSEKGHSVAAVPAVSATCTKDGSTEGRECAVCGKIFKVSDVIPALGHDWGSPAYTWAEDHSRCTAAVVCNRDTRHTITETAAAEIVVTVEPTMYTAGSGICYASFSDPMFEKQEKSITLPRLPKSGWLKEDGKWYFYKDDTAQTGWVKVDGKWYYFNTSGVMQKGWQKVDGKWYYLNPAGDMVTGWKKISDKWYYFNSGGVMQTGWQEIDGKTYYLKPSGEMAANEWCKGWWLNKNGTWTYPYKASWKKNSKGWYYEDTSGWYAKDCTITIDGKSYTFNSRGYLEE